MVRILSTKVACVIVTENLIRVSMELRKFCAKQAWHNNTAGASYDCQHGTYSYNYTCRFRAQARKMCENVACNQARLLTSSPCIAFLVSIKMGIMFTANIHTYDQLYACDKKIKC